MRAPACSTDSPGEVVIGKRLEPAFIVLVLEALRHSVLLLALAAPALLPHRGMQLAPKIKSSSACTVAVRLSFAPSPTWRLACGAPDTGPASRV